MKGLHPRRGHTTRVIATGVITLLLAAVLMTQAVDRSRALQCYVMQQASKHRLVYDQGFAAPDEIREIVWNHTVAAFDGQVWRATLDHIFHVIFMGGERGEQVVAQLGHPDGESSDLHCFGYMGWAIRDSHNDTDFDRFGGFDGFSGSGIEAVHQVTTALQAIPAEKLRHYRVEASDVSGSAIWSEREPVWTYRELDAGETSAQAWLRGEIAPSHWSGWYAYWQERQETDDE